MSSYVKNHIENEVKKSSYMYEIDSGLEAINLTRYSHGLKQFITQCEPYNRGEIRNCTSFNELLATCVLKDYRELFLESDNYNGTERAALKNIDKLLMKDDSLLVDVTEDVLERAYAEMPEFHTRDVLRFVRYRILARALEEGALVPCYPKQGSVLLLDMYMKNIALAGKTNTVLELFAKYWSYYEGTRNSIISIVENIKDKDLEDLTYDDILNGGREIFSDKSLKTLRYVINRYFIKPAIKDGLLPRNFLDRNNFDELLRTHLDDRENINKEDRTVGWYIFEYHNSATSYMANKKYLFMKTYGDIIGKKANKLSRKDVDGMRNYCQAGRFAFVPIVNMIINDGLCNSDVFEHKEESVNEDFSFDDDIWKFSVRASIDFNGISSGFREAVKHYVWRITDGLKKTLSGGFVNIELLFEIIEKIGARGIGDISNGLKKKLYIELREYAETTSASKGKSMLKNFRRFIRTMKDIDYKGLDSNISIDIGEMKISSSYSKINTYTDSEMEDILKFVRESPDRLRACAIGLQALYARRISETVSYNEAKRYSGFKVDALRKLGVSDEYVLVYEAEKQKKIVAVPLSVMIGKREDVFAKNIIELGVALFNEAIQITSAYRKHAPKKLKKYLFIEPKLNGGYGLIRGSVIRNIFNEFKKNTTISKEKSFHEFRHTMVTNIILSGGTVADAADALADEVKTVASYYHSYAQRHDTVKYFALRGRSEMVMPLEDSAFFSELNKSKHQVVLPSELEQVNQDVVGGKCIASVYEMCSCPSYRMINSESGCAGCKSFRIVAYIHTEYWKRQQTLKLREMSIASKGGWWFEKAKAGYKQATNILEQLEEKELEHELGI